MTTIAPHRPLSFIDSFTLGISATAPFYSIVVTLPLVLAINGTAAPWIYLLAFIPSALVCYSMTVCEKQNPDKGTVYTWAKNKWHKRIAGLSLATTGIIATAGMAVVASWMVLQWFGVSPSSNTLLASAVAGLLVAVAALVDLKSLKLMAVVQILAVVFQVISLAFLIPMMFNPSVIEQGNAVWEFDAVLHGVLLCVFSYWGFDAVFALTEETKENSARAGAVVSVIALVAFYVAFAMVAVRVGLDVIVAHPVISVAVFLSAVMSLGSTMLPTARGLQAMAEDGQVFKQLSDKNVSGWWVLVLSAFFCGIAAISQNVFDDLIEAISIFVGVYFVSSCVSAYRMTKNWIHVVSGVLMGFMTLGCLVMMFDVEYGSTSLLGVGGVAWLVVGLSAVGIVLMVVQDRVSKSSENV